MGMSLMHTFLTEDRKQVHREPLNKHSNIHDDNGVKRSNLGVVHNDKGAKDASNSYAYFVKGSQNLKVNTDLNPALVLDDSCLNQKDYSLCLMGKVKDFASLSKLKVVLVNEGFSNIKLRYMGGYWVMIEFQSANMGVGTWFSHIQQVSHDFIIDERVTWVEIEDFVEDNEEENESDDESYEDEPNVGDFKNVEDLEGDSDGDAVPDTKFDEEPHIQNDAEVSVGQNNVQSEDPFNLYELLNKKRDGTTKDFNSDDSLRYPLAFTPRDNIYDTGDHSYGSCHTPKRGLDGIRVRGRDVIAHLKYKA
nr:nucleotide-binding alpha-beta plait domain-containing protein [Tanacetum cinerariifolium]